MNTIMPMAWVSWAMVTFFYAFQYIIRVFPSVMMHDISTKFNINATDFGNFSGAYYLGYSLMNIPFGLMLDRKGAKVVIPLAVILSVCGIVPLLYSDSWTLAVIGRFLIGAGSSAGILGVFKVIQMQFPENQFSRILGISVTVGLLGGMYGGLPVNNLNVAFGWQNVLLGFIVLGLVLAAIIFLILPKSPESDFSPTNVMADLKLVFSHKRIVITALLAGLMVGPLEGFADIWGVSYLVNVMKIDQSIASGLPSLIFLGMGVGCPLLAYLAEKMGKYKEIIIGSAFYMAAAFALILLTHLNQTTLSILFFTIGIACSYQVIMIYMNSKNVSPSHSGIVISFTNMTIMAFGYFFHKVISVSMDLLWDGTVINKLPVYGPLSYKFGLAIIPISLIIAGCGMVFVTDKTKQCRIKT